MKSSATYIDIRRSAAIGLMMAVLALLVSLVFGHSLARAATCGGYNFPCSSIISDTSMSSTGTMSEAQIQSFLVQQGSYLAGYTVQQHTGVGWSDNIDPYGWSAAHMIWEAANWYNLNPEVILTSLQKEESLVQDPAPASWALDYAMGYGCPDGAGCSVTYLGFGQQVDMGAWQLAQNMAHANAKDTNFVGPYYTGNTINIDCDSNGNNCTAVHLDNGATASLYRYTPHIHGNYLFYTIWNRYGFGSAPPPPPPPPPPAPQIGGQSPVGGSTVVNNRPMIYAAFSDAGSAINAAATVIQVDGVNVSTAATLTAGYASYRPPFPLSAGNHSVTITVTDAAGVSKSASWSFTVSSASTVSRDYYWSWYDGVGSQDWMFMANPSGTASLGFDIAIGGRPVDINSQVAPGQTLPAMNPGIQGGPITAMSLTGGNAVVSQRVLWGDSLEEVPPFDSSNFSDHYYWTWYDNRSPGYTDWVMVSNPNAAPIYCEIRIAGQTLIKSVIPTGGNITPTFPGVQGGPVEVQAWTTQSKSAPAPVIASQRVLSSGGAAFNEVPGTAALNLSDHYFWTWYDNQSAGSTDWVLMSNPSSIPVYYEIRIGGRLKGSGSLAAGGTLTPAFPGIQSGPVEVQAWSSQSKQSPAKIIASQRVVWGPSFEETPGLPATRLKPDYMWTWYDDQSAGATDWVMVSNQNQSMIYYEVTVAGRLKASGVVPAGGTAEPVLGGVIGGPVEVRAWTDLTRQTPASVIASQRVLWHGHFNEVMGAPAG